MKLLLSKILALIFTCGIILVCILLPIRLSRWVERMGARGRWFLRACTCFGGGVFLGTYMLYMRPEARKLIEESLTEPENIKYPIPEAVSGAGFFLIFFTGTRNRLAAVLMIIMERRMKAKEKSKLEASVRNRTNGEQPGVLVFDNEVFPSTEDGGEKSDTDVEKNGGTSEKNNVLQLLSYDMHPRTIILMIALSADCIFEGLAMGLKSTVGAVWSLFIGVVGHEFIVSFCLGLELVRTQKRVRTTVISGVVYALTPAVGLAIGIGVWHLGSESRDVKLVNGVLHCISTGVFLYCTFLGLLADELGERSKFSLVFTVLIGFLLMLGLAAIPEKEIIKFETNSTLL